jgi:hypothetical protein
MKFLPLIWGALNRRKARTTFIFYIAQTFYVSYYSSTAGTGDADLPKLLSIYS